MILPVVAVHTIVARARASHAHTDVLATVLLHLILSLFEHVGQGHNFVLLGAMRLHGLSQSSNLVLRQGEFEKLQEVFTSKLAKHEHTDV